MQTYLSNREVAEMFDDLTPQEGKVYTFIRDVCLGNNPAEALSNKNLAEALNITQKNLSNLKSILKNKGYLVMVWGSDSDGTKNCKVYAGKEQVQWYNWGLRVEISNVRAHRKLLGMFPIDQVGLSLQEREDLVKQANQYYLEHSAEFN
jgi:hypothetical protein